MIINDAEMRQNEFNSIVDALNNYIPRIQKYNEAKNSLLNNAKSFYEGRKKLLKALKKEYFRQISDDNESEQQQTSKKPTKDDVNAFNEWVNKEETDLNKKLFEKHFNFQRPSSMLKYL